MAIIQEFQNDGWKEHPPNPFKHADQFFQKVIKSGDKNAFYINAWVYHPSTFENKNNTTVINGSISCEAVMYCVEKDIYWFTVELFDCQDKSLEDIYNFFDRIYRRMKCIPDIHNND